MKSKCIILLLSSLLAASAVSASGEFSAWVEADLPRDLEREAHAARLAAAQALLRLDEADAAEAQLEQVPPPQRGWEWRFLHSRLDRSLHTLPLDVGPALAVRFSDDGRTVASVDAEAMQIWDLSTRTVTERRPFLEPLAKSQRVLISADFRYIAIITAAGADVVGPASLHVIDTTVGERVARVGVSPFDGVAFAPDSSQLAIRHISGSVVLIELPGGRTLIEFDVSRSPSGAVAFKPDGTVLATVDEGLSVALWNGATGEKISQLQFEPSALIEEIAFAPDGSSIAVANARGWIMLHDLEEDRSRVLRQQPQATTSLAFGDGGSLLATLTDSGRFELLDARTGNVVTRGRGLPSGGDDLDLNSSPMIVATCGAEGVKLFAAAPSLEVLTLPHRDSIVSLDISPDGNRLLVAPLTGPMRSWDPIKGAITEDFGDRNPPGEVSYSRDGSLIFAAARKGEIRVWDVAEASLIRSVPVESDDVLKAALSRDGTVALGDRNGDIRILSPGDPAAEQRTELPLFEHPVSAIAISSDGKKIAAASRDGGLALLSATDFRTPMPLAQLDTAPLSLSFAPEGDTLAAGGADGVIYLFDLEATEPVRVLQAHEGGVLALAFSPDGSRLVSGGMDRKLRIWWAGLRLSVLTLDAHRRPITCAAWCPDGSCVVSGDLAGKVIIWDDRPAHSLVSVE